MVYRTRTGLDLRGLTPNRSGRHARHARSHGTIDPVPHVHRLLEEQWVPVAGVGVPGPAERISGPARSAERRRLSPPGRAAIVRQEACKWSRSEERRVGKEWRGGWS